MKVNLHLSLPEAIAMPNLPCSLGSGCNKGQNGNIWRSEDLPFQQAQELVRDHVQVAHHHLMVGPTPAQLKVEKLPRTSLKVKDNLVEEEAYEFFMHQWETYKAQANLTVNSK